MIGSGTTSTVVSNAPPALVVGTTILGIPLNDWVLYATLLWVTLQIVDWVWTRVKRYKEGKSGKSQ